MKKNIAIVWGGYSSEVVVSAKSMQGIYSFMDKDKYNVYKVKIVREGWSVELDGAEQPIDKNDFSFIDQQSKKKICIDFAYITIHGTPGEDGLLQGYFEMLRIPYSTPGVMSSALTFNKFVCNNYLKSFGFDVAKSTRIKKGEKYIPKNIVNELGLPLFVKPSIGGSSFATTKVKEESELQNAIQTALDEAPEAIIESFIKGREVTCGCYQTGDKYTVLPISEVVTQNEFFDYKAKYEGESEEITPARLPEAMANKIKELTTRIYNLVNARGIIRADFIIADETPYLLEVNTTPGMTAQSFIPQQVAAAGRNMTDVLTEIIENEFSNYK